MRMIDCSFPISFLDPVTIGLGSSRGNERTVKGQERVEADGQCPGRLAK